MTNLEKNRIIHTLKMYKSFGIEYIDQIDFNKKKENDSNLPEDLDSLESYVEHCSLCHLSKQKDKNVFGNGDVNSDIYIIGVNQYFKNKDVYDIFKNMIERVLLRDINSVYITNILKCDTSNTVKNIEESIDICMNYLIKQIDLSSVKIIITLGDCFKYMINNDSDVVDVSGNLFDYNGIKLVPILDPDFLYKNPSYKQQMFNDLKKIKTIME